MKKFAYSTDKNAVKCVIARRICGVREYTWAVSSGVEVSEGDILEVTIKDSDKPAFVEATSQAFYAIFYDSDHKPHSKVLSNVSKECGQEEADFIVSAETARISQEYFSRD